MAKFVLIVVVLVVVEAHRPHPKLLRFASEETDGQNVIKKGACNSTHAQLRNDYILKSKCGDPKDVFVELKLQGSYLQVTPSAVWVKRCVGLCDYAARGSQCVATQTKIEHVPVKIYNLKTDKYTCSTYAVEVHEKCGCCVKDCAAPKVFNPRKCSCQCPNLEERRNCLKQRNSNMRWNRSKCVCEAKRRVTW
ncbi:uncharacterized protein LOC123692125 isoform X1 [Colias croceus]|uniref:uncharacterized protein LOC123692125 isoform X1 n=1 Tax=Colias crocea TaxID=72248 RepID=UPI001E27F111|nr:uncharacterized protein LOC123692125 isoform X1 [Colias croceus]